MIIRIRVKLSQGKRKTLKKASGTQHPDRGGREYGPRFSKNRPGKAQSIQTRQEQKLKPLNFNKRGKDRC